MSLADFLGLLRPPLDRVLADDERWGRMVSVARNLAGCAHGGFECRLAFDDDRVDLQVNLKPGHPALPSCPQTHGFWERLETFQADWSLDSSQARRTVRSVWLEFDLDRTGAALPVPSVFFTWHPGRRTPEQIVPPVASLAGQAIGVQAAGAVRSLVGALPSTARLSHLGVMLSRPGAPLRLNIEGVDGASLFPFLRAAGWPGHEAGLQRVMEMLAPLCSSMALALDAGPDGLEASIGLECDPGCDSSDPSEAAWPLLEELCQRALCTRGKAAGVASWRGVTWRGWHREVWPPELEWPDRFFAATAESAFLRYLNHIKVTLRADGRVVAKAYLAWEHRWLERSALLALSNPADSGRRER